MMGIEPYLGPAALISTLTGPAPHFRENDPELDALYAELIAGDTWRAARRSSRRSRSASTSSWASSSRRNRAHAGQSRAASKGFRPFRFPRMYDVWIE
jgi:peptide/nickel transport system substrate-binding protein